jgi:hypothetical protein
VPPGGESSLVIENLFERDRIGRLVLFNARSASNPSLDEVTRTVIARTWGAAPSSSAGAQALRRTVQQVVLNTLLDRASDAEALPDVRATLEMHLESLRSRLAAATGGTAPDRALRAKAVRDIRRYFEGNDDPKTRSRFAVLPLPWP